MRNLPALEQALLSTCFQDALLSIAQLVLRMVTTGAQHGEVFVVLCPHMSIGAMVHVEWPDRPAAFAVIRSAGQCGLSSVPPFR
jgi:hypothetical protein